MVAGPEIARMVDEFELATCSIVQTHSINHWHYGQNLRVQVSIYMRSKVFLSCI